jgi:hypothetical protein
LLFTCCADEIWEAAKTSLITKRARSTIKVKTDVTALRKWENDDAKDEKEGF